MLPYRKVVARCEERKSRQMHQFDVTPICLRQKTTFNKLSGSNEAADYVLYILACAGRMPGPFFRIGTPSKQQPKTVKDILRGRNLAVLCWRRISPTRRRDVPEVSRGERGQGRVALGGCCTPSVKETSHDRESTHQGPCKSSHFLLAEMPQIDRRISFPLHVQDYNQERRMPASGDPPYPVKAGWVGVFLICSRGASILRWS